MALHDLLGRAVRVRSTDPIVRLIDRAAFGSALERDAAELTDKEL